MDRPRNPLDDEEFFFEGALEKEEFRDTVLSNTSGCAFSNVSSCLSGSRRLFPSASPYSPCTRSTQANVQRFLNVSRCPLPSNVLEDTGGGHWARKDAR